ncbi:hypothetical protein FQN60_014910 [Etheostoma spectabile]|uniref:Uncharacterized protein n=1 Tax=Etheostoma spectabile TaxID=54343 RepID=A0A5J5CP29_9PERO|nr:hypothetical protein FQN60_014910 [Etheostoma spectabile]
MITIDLPPEMIKNPNYYRNRITVAMVPMLVDFHHISIVQLNIVSHTNLQEFKKQCDIIFLWNIIYADLEIHAY